MRITCKTVNFTVITSFNDCWSVDFFVKEFANSTGLTPSNSETASRTSEQKIEN